MENKKKYAIYELSIEKGKPIKRWRTDLTDYQERRIYTRNKYLQLEYPNLKWES